MAVVGDMMYDNWDVKRRVRSVQVAICQTGILSLRLRDCDNACWLGVIPSLRLHGKNRPAVGNGLGDAQQPHLKRRY